MGRSDNYLIIKQNFLDSGLNVKEYFLELFLILNENDLIKNKLDVECVKNTFEENYDYIMGVLEIDDK